MSKPLIRFVLCLVLIIAVGGVYWQTGSHGTVNCDDYYITDLGLFETTIFSFDNFVFGLTYKVCGVWMPLTYFIVGVETVLFGDNYGAWHLFAAFIHSLNAILLFLLLHKMTHAVWRSFLVAGIFALHPLNVEAVAWLAAIRVVSAAFFALLAFYFYIGYVRSLTFGRYFLAGGCYFISVFFFPMFITVPFVFLLLDVWPFERLQRQKENDQTGESTIKTGQVVKDAMKLVWEKYFFFLVIFLAGLTVISSHDLPVVYQYPFFQRLLNAIFSYGAYLKKLFFPLDLAAFYPYPTEFAAANISGLLALLTGITLLGLTAIRRFPYVIVGWLWFAGMLFPFSGIVQVGTQAMADHYAYLAMVGFWVMIVWAGADLMRVLPYARLLSVILVVAILLACGMVSWRQAGYWKNSETLSRRMLQVTENNYEAFNYLGQALAAEGKIAAAIDAFSRGLLLQPDHLNLNFNMALALTRQGDKTSAIGHYRRILDIDPRHIRAHNNLGTLFQSLGDRTRAEYHYRQAVGIDPDYLAAKYNLADLLADTGRITAALPYYEDLLAVVTDKNGIYNRLASGYLQAGQTEKAAVYLNKARALNPDGQRQSGDSGTQ